VSIMNSIEKHCLSTGGYIVSEGTLREKDLIPAFIDVLSELSPEAYQQLMMPACGFSQVPSYALDDKDSDWWTSEAAGFVLESLFDALNEYGPEGFYFGANEGDGACFGFWECEE
jgi:hypothetical protein